MPLFKNKSNAEEHRLEEDKTRKAYWRRWGPYLSERQWGTVREDYSANGTAWEYLPHEHARSRAYRWGEDGLFGISDNHQRLCFALALWNGNDPILKERLFGLTGNEGNHGEDVKEQYFYLDNVPSHSYMKALYKYPQAAFPYEQILAETRRRTRKDPEYELLDTGVFSENRYLDVFVEYAKAAPNDCLIRLTAINRGPDPAPLHLLPMLWFRNTWSWKKDQPKPSLRMQDGHIVADHATLGSFNLTYENPKEVLFTENETNRERLFHSPNPSPFVKDGFNECVVHGNRSAVNAGQTGTRAAVHYEKTLAPGETWTLQLRLSDTAVTTGSDFDHVFSARQREADAFYQTLLPASLSADAHKVQRQAFAGLLWSKQFYHYIVKEWLDGDPTQPPPPRGREQGRNHEWKHVYTGDILSMPDTWEYPWFAAWDLGFHCLTLAMIDPELAKHQLRLFTREWYMRPNGQLPAYEWAFGDTNPPVHAWAALRVYQIEKKMHGQSDIPFLESVFQKLLINFTWWINQKDAEGNNIFEGGFLGLDNIGVFDRNDALPSGEFIEQSDGTSWMAMYALDMLAIANELAHHNPVYEDIASKFFEHFLYIAEAMRHVHGDPKAALWDKQDGFFYDTLHLSDGHHERLKVRSLVGLIPLFAVRTIDKSTLQKLPGFAKRVDWFMENRPDLARDVTCQGKPGIQQRRLLSIATPEMLKRILEKVLDESEFLSPHGIRSVSRYHLEHPYQVTLNGRDHHISYEPGESQGGTFGGNSNWRGPVWMPINFLLIESLQRFHHYLGDDFKVECPTGSGHWMNLWDVAAELSRRLTTLFLKDDKGRRAIYQGRDIFEKDAHWQDLILFNEYFHGDTGASLGAGHQTGWTALVAKLLQQQGTHAVREPAEKVGPPRLAMKSL